MELQPLTGRNDSSTTLATLPHDIVRILIREVGPPVDKMRLIGHNWNSMVTEYLADRKNNPHLEEVFIRNGGPEEEKRIKISLTITQSIHKNHFRRICRDAQWKTTQPDTFVSPILQLRTIELSKPWMFIVFFYFVVAVCAVVFRLHYSISIVIVLLTLALLAYLFIAVRPKDRDNRDNISALFARCSHIGELSLIHLNRETLDVVRDILKDVPIKHLIIYDKKCDAELREKIVKMASIHKIETITMCAKKMEKSKLRKFFLSVTETANELQIYESSEKDDKIFGKPREFWDEEAKNISDESIIVQVMNGMQNDKLREGSQRFRLKIRP
ncbi:hypothetical protein PRIPAC_81823 [Pristionchus pacificus]|uniref:Uncharacterized protein n=1 Tax=Pristionchus pacificus TaxID=54126 RepID=A0A2A6CKU9_PRIPA|nr:hypothetical protein PRIPAC_81823 [Pristionchus pacificus]|eukprot:PDM78855.1 hypothetical protein PRIPAC_31434 [Pristionchus pacificus]